MTAANTDIAMRIAAFVKDPLPLLWRASSNCFSSCLECSLAALSAFWIWVFCAVRRARDLLRSPFFSASLLWRYAVRFGVCCFPLGFSSLFHRAFICGRLSFMADYFIIRVVFEDIEFIDVKSKFFLYIFIRPIP